MSSGSIFGASPYSGGVEGGSIIGLGQTQGWSMWPFNAASSGTTRDDNGNIIIPKYDGYEAFIRATLEALNVVAILIIFVSLFVSADAGWAKFSRGAIGYLVGSFVAMNVLDYTPNNDKLGLGVAVAVAVTGAVTGTISAAVV